MARPHPYMPYLATALGVALFSLMDALMKHASIALGAYSALLCRSLIGAAIMAPLWKWRGGTWPRAHVLRIHVTRAVVACGMLLLFFHGLTLLPIAEAIALSFISPLIALYLAAILLGERIGRRALLASFLGLAGVFLISVMRYEQGLPHGQPAEGILAVLGSALLYAWNLILQRQLAQVAGPADVAFSQHTLTGLILLVPAPWLVVAPDLSELGVLALSAILATMCLMLLSWAYARAETQALVTVEYSGFLWAVLFGWLFFAESVTPATLTGAALIIVACWIGAPRTEPEQVAV